MSLIGPIPGGASPFHNRQALTEEPRSSAKERGFELALADQNRSASELQAKAAGDRHPELSHRSLFSSFGAQSPAETQRPAASSLATQSLKDITIKATKVFHHQSNQRYVAHPKIGDDAVAFSARGIVGPSRVRFVIEKVTSAGSQLAQPEGLHTHRQKSAEQKVNGLSQAFAAKPQLGRAIAGSSLSSVARPTIQITRPNPLAALSRSQFGAASLVWANNRSVSNSEPHTSNTQGTRSSTQTQVPALQRAQSPAVAQLLASPSDYRLMIRGKSLSESERDYVVREINLALTQLGLALQPVRVMHQKREA